MQPMEWVAIPFSMGSSWDIYFFSMLSVPPPPGTGSFSLIVNNKLFEFLQGSILSYCKSIMLISLGTIK